MKPVLTSALQAIRAERSSGFRVALEEARCVLEEFGEPGIADRLMQEAAPDVPAEDLADLLGILTWSGTDHGAGIARDAERWLREGTDERRIWIALNLDHVPFPDRDEMERVLGRIAEDHPSLAAHCRELVARRRQHEA